MLPETLVTLLLVLTLLLLLLLLVTLLPLEDDEDGFGDWGDVVEVDDGWDEMGTLVTEERLGTDQMTLTFAVCAGMTAWLCGVCNVPFMAATAKTAAISTADAPVTACAMADCSTKPSSNGPV